MPLEVKEHYVESLLSMCVLGQQRTQQALSPLSHFPTTSFRQSVFSTLSLYIHSSSQVSQVSTHLVHFPVAS